MISGLAGASLPSSAPRVNGKFLDVNGERFLVKGVAYGTFAPDESGGQFPPLVQIAHDFSMMAAAGINTVRTYTVPPESLLDEAACHGLRVMIGMPWAQHVAFLDDARLKKQIRHEAGDTVRRLSSHPAALLFSVGNEIPPAVVRWHGQRRIERFLRDLYEEIKAASPTSLLTYVNFPPTEYLDLDCFDVAAFNVYLHRERDLRAYLARLQHVAGNKPLLLAEAGADSIRQGMDGQAQITGMHIRAAFSEGLCGAVAFSWTDEWWRGGQPVDDWAFGLVDADRRPKAALASVSSAFRDAPFSRAERATWPKVSVVVCAYNAADTLDDCLSSLQNLTYPNAEIIVVNDGSRDQTSAVAHRYPVEVIDIPNGGLSAARNVGLARASGEIVAYTDADVRVDPDWLTYLVQPILTHNVIGSGGPNVVPADDPVTAQCVARAPGGPTHVLLDDRVAEHVPGCNMAFRRDALLSIGGFNPVYLRAGDDVDVCWRLQAKGFRIGFAPAALVWHHHRASVKAYWRQQVGYGEGEAWLDAHHPEKFVGGQMLWRGRIYSPLPFIRSLSGRRVNSGVWGTAAFPSVYRTEPHAAHFLLHSPVWMMASTLLIGAGLAAHATPFPGAAWLILLTGLLGWAMTVARCIRFALDSDLDEARCMGTLSDRQSRACYRTIIAWLHIVQPIARMYGRLKGMWSPPSVVAPEHVTRVPWKAPVPSLRDAAASALLLMGGGAERAYWSETWTTSSALLTELAGVLRASRPARHVDVDDGWHADRDLRVSVGPWGWLHLRTLVEEHAQGRCLFRVGACLRPSFGGVIQALILVLTLLIATSAGMVLRWPAVSVAAAGLVLGLFVRAAWQTTRANAVVARALVRVTATAGMIPLAARGGVSVRTRVRVRPATPAQLMQGVVVAALVTSTGISTVALAHRISATTFVPSVSVATASPVSERPIATSGGVAVSAAGDLLVADQPNGLIQRLRVRLPLEPLQAVNDLKVFKQRVLGMPVQFESAADIAVAPNGDTYVADARNHRICRIDRVTGKITTEAGYGLAGFDGDDIQATQTALNSPSAVVVGRSGDLYIADTLNNRVRVVAHTTGVIRTIAGGGASEAGSLGDGGPARAATLKRPSGLVLASNGDIYIADTGNHRVRKVDADTGIITTVAGDGVAGASGDGGPAAYARLSSPTGLALVQAGSRHTLYVADSASGTIRVIAPNRTISTIASRQLISPTRLAYHPAGWLYVKDARSLGVIAIAVAKQAHIELAVAVRRASPRKVT